MRSLLVPFLLVAGCTTTSTPCDDGDCEVAFGKADGQVQVTFPPLENHLYPFMTDGCSSFPDGDWVDCCKRHDFAYWAGGTADERKAADEGLRSCVTATGHVEIAQTMYLGVRAFGGPDQTASYRWGYGWRYNRGYKALDAAARDAVAALAPTAPEAIAIATPTYSVEPYPTKSGNYCADEAYYGLRSILSADSLASLSKFDGRVDEAGFRIEIATDVCTNTFSARLSVALRLDQEGCAMPRYTDEQPTHFLTSIKANGDCAAALAR